MNRLKNYLILRWTKKTPLKFIVKSVCVVKVKKGKIREWRAFVDGKRISKEELQKLQKQHNF
jgi:limonene-1,2-epoxide hydrolase